MHRTRHGGPSNPSGEKAQLVLAYQELSNELHSTQLKVIGNYTLGRVIGEGSFGTVRLGIHRLTGSRVAIKHIPKSSSPPLLTREIHHHRRLHHPNVVQLYEVIATEHSIWLITELCAGGELFDYLVEKTYFSEYEARRLFGQICLGLGYVHRQGVVHRDLKLENVLLDERCNPKLADFGFGREFEPRKLLDTYCGTTGYASPEMLAGKKYLGQEADIWSLGIILHALLTGSLPFDDDDEDKMKAMIMAGHFEIPNFVSNEACNLIQSILQQDPKARPSIERILSHPWFTNPPLQHSFGESEPLSRPSPILEEALQLAKSPPLSIVTLPPTETPDRSSSLKHPPPTFPTQANKSTHSALASDTSQFSSQANNMITGSGRNGTSSSAELNAIPDTSSSPLHDHSHISNMNNNQSQGQASPVECKNNLKSSVSTNGGADVSLNCEKSRDPPALAINLPHFKAKAGSLKPLPLTALTNIPSTLSHPQIRTPSRTKRRSVGSTLSERMGPFEDGAPSDLATPTTNQARLSVSSLLTVVIDYVGALKATTQAPLLSQEDLVFLKSLGSLGFDSGQIIHSVQSYACDSSGALWWLLKKKLDQQLINRDDVLSPNPSTIHPSNQQDLQSRQPSTTADMASDSISPSDLTSDSHFPVSYHKSSVVGTPDDSPLATLKFKPNSSSDVLKKSPSLVRPILSITKSQDRDLSSDRIKVEKQVSTQNPVIAEDRSYLNPRGDPASSKNSSTLAAIPANFTDDARSSVSSTRMDTPSGSDKDTPHIIIDPTSVSKKSSPDLRKRSQSVNMLQRATYALATKRSVDDKHSKSRSREASSANDGDEKYGNEKMSKKDLKAREKESKMEENSKFSSNLPRSGLFSRKTLLHHPLPHLQVSLMSHQTPPQTSDKSVDKHPLRLKENDVPPDNSLISSPPSTPSKGNVSRITSREASDADLNLPVDNQTPSSSLSLHASSSSSHAASQSMPFNNLDAFCTPKPHSERSTIVPSNSKSEDYKSLKEPSPAITSLSEIASSHKPSPSESEIAQGHRHKSTKGNLFSNFRFWFNEDRRKRKQTVPVIANYNHLGTSPPTGRMAINPGVRSPPVGPNIDNDPQIRKGPVDSQTVRSPIGPVAVHRRPSKGSRRSSMQSNRQVTTELRNNSSSKRRSDSSRASFSSIAGTRTPGSEPGSHLSGSQSTINPSRGSSDGHGRSRRPETNGRRISINSTGSRRSTAPLQHLAPNQSNSIFVMRTSSTGTTVRRVSAHGSSSSSNRPRPPKAPSFTSSVRTSISSDEGLQLLNRRASGGPDDHRLHSPIAVHEVEETIEEEDDGGEEDERKNGKSIKAGREANLNTDDARQSAFQKLSGGKPAKTHSPSSHEGGSNNQSGNLPGTSTRSIFMAHKPHSVFGTPTQAFFARSTQSPVAPKFNTASNTGNGTSYSTLMKSIADGPTSRKSSAEPKLRDVFANKAKEEGEWIDVDDEDDECSRYEGGIGQGVKSRNEGTSGVVRTGGSDVHGTVSVGKLEFKLSKNNQVSASSAKTPGHVKSFSTGSSSTIRPKPSNSFNSVSDSIGNSPAASLIGNWRGGNPRVTSNFKSIAIEEEEEED